MIHSSPAIGADGTIYVGSDDGKLYAINPDGTQKWAFTTGGLGHFLRRLLALTAPSTWGSYDNKLYALNPNGTEVGL